MKGQVQVDDMDCGWIVMEEADAPNLVYRKEGFIMSATTLKPFMFAPLKLTGACLYHTKLVGSNSHVIDDDDFLDASALTELGNIVLSIYRIEITSIKDRAPKKPPQERPVHERSKKATAHIVRCVSLMIYAY